MPFFKGSKKEKKNRVKDGESCTESNSDFLSTLSSQPDPK